MQVHLYTQVESGLTAKTEEDTIGLLTLDHVSHIFGGDWEIVHFVGQLVVGLDKIAMLGLISTDLTPASLRALRAWEPTKISTLWSLLEGE